MRDKRISSVNTKAVVWEGKWTKFSVYRLPPLLCECFITPQCLHCGTEGDRKEGREEDRGCLHIEENTHWPTVPPAPSFSSISPFWWRWIPSTNPSRQSHSSNKHSTDSFIPTRRPRPHKSWPRRQRQPYFCAFLLNWCADRWKPCGQ